jgi:hypothetical protein
LKTARDTLKTSYDALIAKDEDGSITAAELTRLEEIDIEFFDLDHEYQEAKSLVEER